MQIKGFRKEIQIKRFRKEIQIKGFRKEIHKDSVKGRYIYIRIECMPPSVKNDNTDQLDGNDIGTRLEDAVGGTEVEDFPVVRTIPAIITGPVLHKQAAVNMITGVEGVDRGTIAGQISHG